MCHEVKTLAAVEVGILFVAVDIHAFNVDKH